MNQEERHKFVLKKVTNFIRVDGPTDAPFVFLTMEDGGGLDKEYFEKHIINSEKNIEQWIPSPDDRPLNKNNTGKPGEYISKIMSCISGDFEKWEDYRVDHLYSKNECNIKFYPISKKSHGDQFPDWLEKEINMTAQEYFVYCDAERPGIIFNDRELHTIFSDTNRIFIILGAKEQWYYLLRRYTFGYKLIKREKENKKFELIFDREGNMLFAYINIFRWGLLNKDIETFCEKITKYIPEEVIKSISGHD